MKKKKEPKTCHTTVRMTEEVRSYVLRCEGRSFADKFQNMVLLCMRTAIYEQERDRLARIKDLDNQILNKKRIINRLEETFNLMLRILEEK